MKYLCKSLSAVLMIVLTASSVLASDFVIETANGSEKEKQTVAQFKQLFTQHDVSRFGFTKKIRIEQFVIPHSHPVLTLNTKYLKDDGNALSVFLHEQLHWYLDANTEKVEAAIGDLREHFPSVPVGKGQGARSEYSSYLHLIVCMLEHDSLASYVGTDEASRVTTTHRHYRWIYDQVLEQTDLLRAILKKHGLDAPQA